MSKYPRAWGAILVKSRHWTEGLWDADPTGENVSDEKVEFVELIPLPEVEAMIAAERERCISIIEATDIVYPSDTRYCQLGDARETMVRAIDAIRKGGDTCES